MLLNYFISTDIVRCIRQLFVAHCFSLFYLECESRLVRRKNNFTNLFYHRSCDVTIKVFNICIIWRFVFSSKLTTLLSHRNPCIHPRYCYRAYIWVDIILGWQYMILLSVRSKIYEISSDVSRRKSYCLFYVNSEPA